MRARAFNAGSVNLKMGDCGGVPAPPPLTACGDMGDLDGEMDRYRIDSHSLTMRNGRS